MKEQKQLKTTCKLGIVIYCIVCGKYVKTKSRNKSIKESIKEYSYKYSVCSKCLDKIWNNCAKKYKQKGKQK